MNQSQSSIYKEQSLENKLLFDEEFWIDANILNDDRNFQIKPTFLELNDSTFDAELNKQFVDNVLRVDSNLNLSPGFMNLIENNEYSFHSERTSKIPNAIDSYSGQLCPRSSHLHNLMNSNHYKISFERNSCQSSQSSGLSNSLNNLTTWALQKSKSKFQFDFSFEDSDIGRSSICDGKSNTNTPKSGLEKHARKNINYKKVFSTWKKLVQKKKETFCHHNGDEISRITWKDTLLHKKKLPFHFKDEEDKFNVFDKMVYEGHSSLLSKYSDILKNNTNNQNPNTDVTAKSKTKERSNLAIFLDSNVVSDSANSLLSPKFLSTLTGCNLYDSKSEIEISGCAYSDDEESCISVNSEGKQYNDVQSELDYSGNSELEYLCDSYSFGKIDSSVQCSRPVCDTIVQTSHFKPSFPGMKRSTSDIGTQVVDNSICSPQNLNHFYKFCKLLKLKSAERKARNRWSECMFTSKGILPNLGFLKDLSVTTSNIFHATIPSLSLQNVHKGCQTAIANAVDETNVSGRDKNNQVASSLTSINNLSGTNSGLLLNILCHSNNVTASKAPV